MAQMTFKVQSSMFNVTAPPRNFFERRNRSASSGRALNVEQRGALIEISFDAAGHVSRMTARRVWM
jgi:hypothetical protein